MANPNYILLERITVGAAGASSVTFANIPQTGYTDLKVVMSVRTSWGNVPDWGSVRFNGDSGNNYSFKYINGSGSAAGSSSASGANHAEITTGWVGASSTANTFANCEMYIPNYLGSTQKSFSVDATGENNASAAYSSLNAMLWTGTAAIFSITLASANGATISQYSTFSLYALAADGTTPTVAPYAIGGDIIQTDGTYWYHAFINSGYFTPNKALSCDVLVVAAGGGGGGQAGGGGGAGGVLALTSQSLTANTTLTANVGAGGTAATGNTISGSNGGNTQLGALTAATGGGGGGSRGGTITGNNGGSGGGGSYPGGAGGTGSQGNSGGAGNGGAGSGGGGGGYGAAGFNGTGTSGGVGGAGTNSAISWQSSAFTLLGLGVSGYIAGGGGGGNDYTYPTAAGGSGGGGTSANNGTAAQNGVANTGSGGGGGSYNPVYGGIGGSGLIVLRYAI